VAKKDTLLGLAEVRPAIAMVGKGIAVSRLVALMPSVELAAKVGSDKLKEARSAVRVRCLNAASQ